MGHKIVDIMSEYYKKDKGIPKIVLSVAAEKMEELRFLTDEYAARRPDIVEWRADFFTNLKGELTSAIDYMAEVFSGKEIKLMFTLRTAAQGGKFKGSADEYKAILLEAVNSGKLSMIDIESELPNKKEGPKKDSVEWVAGECIEAAHKKNVNVVTSYHNFETTPPDMKLMELLSDMKRKGADICKLAVTPNCGEDVARIMKLTEMARKRGGILDDVQICTISMTLRGSISRAAGEAFGSFMTFSYVEELVSAAEAKRCKELGQIDFIRMKELLNAVHSLKKMSAEKTVTPVCLIGSPVAHSLSPRMHNTAYEAMGINYRYFAFDCAGTDLDGVLLCLERLGFVGCSITSPFKNEVMKHLGSYIYKGDSLDKSKWADKACNTLVFKDGMRIGYNTDGVGAVRALLEAGTELEGATVFCIGAGGTAKAVCPELIKAGVEKLYVCSKSKSCEELAESLGRKAEAVNAADKSIAMKLSVSTLILNLTGAGMSGKEKELPLGEGLLKQVLHTGQVCFDAAYQPPKTAFLELAEKQGCSILNGEDMLLYQAAEQIKIWSGDEPPVDVMRTVFQK